MTFVNKPILVSHRAMAKRLLRAGVDYDLNARWERGDERLPEAEQLAKEIADLDWLLFGDSQCLDFGGDGDNGELLIDLINILFELRSAELQIEELDQSPEIRKVCDHGLEDCALNPDDLSVRCFGCQPSQ